jgi:hypothetical protein
MHRRSAIEFEDLPWVPRVLRDGGTDLLHLMFAVIRFYGGAADAVTGLIHRSGARRVVDLCSGGGGGTLEVLNRHGHRLGPLELVLTDLYPNEAARLRLETQRGVRPGLVVRYGAEPVDALADDGLGPGVRTMATALHHFPPAQVTALVAARIRLGQPFAFMDLGAPPPLRWAPAPVLLFVLPAVFGVLALATLLLTPWLRPFTLKRLALTYAVPLVPFLVAWDGSASLLRAYTAQELLDLARAAPGSESYELAAGRSGLAVWLTGVPKGVVPVAPASAG